MICPACDGDTKVVDSRPNAKGIHRRRACAHCGLRFSTQERATTRAIPRADTPQPATKAENRKKLAAYKAARVKLERLESPEKVRYRAKRQRLRAEARKQAEQEGVAPEVIYARWQL